MSPTLINALLMLRMDLRTGYRPHVRASRNTPLYILRNNRPIRRFLVTGQV